MSRFQNAPTLDELIEDGSLDSVIDAVKHKRTGSRFVSPDSDPAYIRHIASGGTSETWQGGSDDWKTGKYRLAEPPAGLRGGTRSGQDFIRDVVAAKRGNLAAYQRLETRGWAEATGAGGGFLTSPDVMPGYLPAMRASAPLRARCSEFPVSSDEVWIALEGTTITVAHVAEAATKPDTTGSVAQKISTVFKVAGTTHLSDELLADSNGAAATLVENQFAKQIGLAIDTAIISGDGTGEPTGIRNAAGVNSEAVDGQSGQALYESVLRAISRITERFEVVDSVVMHPRDAVKFSLQRTTTDEYVFPNGLSAVLPNGIDLVLDANIPSNLGTGTDETIAIVGGLKRACYLFSRTPLVVDASQDAAFTTDETVIRGVERYGFAVVVPGALEILTGIEP